MKNESWQHPFPTFIDKWFDSNNDGKLDTTETIFRDMYLNEINRKANEHPKEYKGNNSFLLTDNSTITPETNFDKKQSGSRKWAHVKALFIILVVLVILVGGIKMVMTVKDSSGLIFMVVYLAFQVGLLLFSLINPYGW